MNTQYIYGNIDIYTNDQTHITSIKIIQLLGFDGIYSYLVEYVF